MKIFESLDDLMEYSENFFPYIKYTNRGDSIFSEIGYCVIEENHVIAKYKIKNLFKDIHINNTIDKKGENISLIMTTDKYIIFFSKDTNIKFHWFYIPMLKRAVLL